MNVAFIILFVVVIIALIFLAYQGLRNVEQVNESKNTYVLNLNEFGCYPDGSVNNLPDVSQNQCCVRGGTTTDLRKYLIPGYNLEVLVSANSVDRSDIDKVLCNYSDNVKLVFCTKDKLYPSTNFIREIFMEKGVLPRVGDSIMSYSKYDCNISNDSYIIKELIY
jgi:hypothetical protein